MLGILLDGAVICGIAALLNDGEMPSFLTALLCGFAISLGSFVATIYVSSWLGIAVLVLLGFVVFFAVINLKPQRSAIGAGLLLVYKVAMAFVWAAMLS